MSKRQPISLNGTTMDMLMSMAEGNHGAITVLMKLMKSDDPGAFMNILSLDDMNIRGTQIWVGYKDHCGQDIEKFEQCIRERDPALVATINARSGIAEQAVTGGASFDHVAGQSPIHRGMGL